MSNQQTRYHMYVSFQDDDKISIFTMDPATGGLDWQEDVAVDGGPAPLAIAPARTFSMWAGGASRRSRATGSTNRQGTSS